MLMFEFYFYVYKVLPLPLGLVTAARCGVSCGDLGAAITQEQNAHALYSTLVAASAFAQARNVTSPAPELSAARASLHPQGC
jgi:hypothetical protein